LSSVSVAALVVSIIVAVMGAVALLFTWRSANAADRSAEAAMSSAVAARESAQAAENALQIEQDRRHDEMRPVLHGRIVPGQDYGAGRNRSLEVRLKGPVPLQSIVVVIPTDAAVKSGMGLTSFNLVPQGGIRVGHPVRCLPPVTLSDDARGQVTAIAQCRGEDGSLWEYVEVPISLDGEWPEL
jgi:hypothetical protein